MLIWLRTQTRGHLHELDAHHSRDWPASRSLSEIKPDLFTRATKWHPEKSKMKRDNSWEIECRAVLMCVHFIRNYDDKASEVTLN